MSVFVLTLSAVDRVLFCVKQTPLTMRLIRLLLVICIFAIATFVLHFLMELRSSTPPPPINLSLFHRVLQALASPFVVAFRRWGPLFRGACVVTESSWSRRALNVTIITGSGSARRLVLPRSCVHRRLTPSPPRRRFCALSGQQQQRL